MRSADKGRTELPSPRSLLLAPAFLVLRYVQRIDVRSLTRSPMAWILVVVALVHGIGIGWGLPASDAWDNDGVAPRDFLAGLAATYTPGRFYTYPPVHLALLAVVTLPIVLVAALRSPSLALPDLIAEILKVPYMTALASVARCVSLLMSLAIVLFLARIAEEIRAGQLGLAPPEIEAPRSRRWLDGSWSDERIRRVGWCVAAFAGANVSLTYYAHTSNLDVPYLFWATWAFLVFSRAIARREPRLLRRAAVLAILAIGTKDQAYAMFLLSLPIALVLFVIVDPWARMQRVRIAKEAGIAMAKATALFAIIDAAIVNPTGFIARVRFLTGSASQDFVEYTRDWTGRIGLLADAGRYFHLQYPKIFLVVIAAGLVHAMVRTRRAPVERRGGASVLALLPLLVAVSFTVTFNWTSLRSNARFLLPQALMLAIYGGAMIESLVFAASRGVRWAMRVTAATGAAVALHACIAVDVNLLFDPRYDAEAWLRAHVRPGETIETYGLNVYLPRFPKDARVIRVGPEPLEKRNPLPGIEEVEAAYGDAPSRDARWIVLSTGWGWRYLIPPDLVLNTGRQLAPTQHRSATDEAATEWFARLVSSSAAFTLVHESMYPLEELFPVHDVHGTSARPVWIYERKLGR